MTATAEPMSGVLPGISRAVRDLNTQIEQISREAHGLAFLTGEAGTERALVARLIHQRSSRARAPFVRISANWKLPPEFAQKIQSASGGTVFLNLVREFSADMQYTLLELALDRTFTDPLSGESKNADIRLILTTSLDMDTLLSRSPLLPELRDLLVRVRLDIPPLRDRREDVPALMRFALARAKETGQTLAEGFDRRLLAALRGYLWPGNAEELLLVAAQAALKARGKLVRFEDLPDEFVTHLPSEVLAIARSARIEEEDTSPPVSVGSGEAVISGADPAIAAALDPNGSGAENAHALSSLPTPAPSSADRPQSVSSSTGTGLPPSRPTSFPPMPGYTPAPAPAMPPSAAASSGARHPSQAGDIARELPPALAAAAARAAERELEAAGLSGVDPNDPRRKRIETLVLSAARLSAQTSQLASQMQGAPPIKPHQPPSLRAIGQLSESDMDKLEKDITLTLEEVLSLRRHLARLNEREREAAATFRDLLVRLQAGNTAPRNEDFQALSGLISQVDNVLSNVTQRLPKISEDIQENLRQILGKR